MTAPVLRVAGLYVALGGAPVLRGVDFAVDAGETVGLIGPNGAGKTTLMRALAGLQRFDTGTITLDSAPLGQVDRRSFAREVAYLPQAGAVHWDVAVRDIVALGRLPHRRGLAGLGSADRDAVDRALADADVAHLADRRIGSLSGGERARALLARVLAVESRVILADEPVAGLDPAHGLDVMAVLARRAAAGTAVVMVLHDLTLALRACRRLVLLSGGETVAGGAPDDVLTPENLAAHYGIRAQRGEAGGRPYIVAIDRIAGGPAP